MSAINDTSLNRLIEDLTEEAEDYVTDSLSAERERAWAYYAGECDLEAPDGRAKFVMREVSDSVDAALPEIIDVFASCGDKIVKFKPRGPEDIAMADQATTVVNYIYQQQNNGFLLTHDYVKNGLVAKTGVFKVEYEEDVTTREIDYSGLTLLEVQELLGDEEIELLEMDFEAPEGTPDGTMPMEGIDLKVKRTTTRPRYCVRVVAPEEFIIHESATHPDTSCLIGERVERRVSEVVAMGFELEEVLTHAGPRYDTAQQEERAKRRHAADSTDYWDNSADQANRPVVIYDVIAFVDNDGDGVAECYHAILAGDQQPKVLRVETAAWQPYCVASPFRVPNQVIGDSMADRLFDLQDVNTALVRATLDNANRVGNPRTVAAEGINLDDLLDNKHGGIVRAESPNLLQDLTVPYIGDKILPIVDYMENRKQQRTGLTRAGQGLDPDALQSSTQEGVEATLTASRRKVKLYAQLFAVGYAQMAMKVWQLIVQHQKKDFLMELNGEFVAMRPQFWHADLDISVEVGLGHGDREEQIQELSAIANAQKEILLQAGPLNPIVSMAQYSNTLRELVELTGRRDPDRYFNPPELVDQKMAEEMERRAQQQGQPDAETQAKIQKAQQETQIKAESAQQNAQIKAAEASQNLQQAREEAAARQDLDERQARSEAALERWKARQEAELDRWKARTEAQLKAAELAEEAELEREAMRRQQANERDAIGNRNLNSSKD